MVIRVWMVIKYSCQNLTSYCITLYIISNSAIRVCLVLFRQFGFSKEQREKDKEKAEKKKAAAAATGRQRAPSTGEEDEYLIEQVYHQDKYVDY